MRDLVVFRMPYRVCSLWGSRMLRSSSRFATVVTSEKVTAKLTSSVIHDKWKFKLTVYI